MQGRLYTTIGHRNALIYSAFQLCVLKAVLMEGLAPDPMNAVALRNGVDTTALKVH